MLPATLPEAGVWRSGIAESGLGAGTRTAPTATGIAMGMLRERAS
jgi:hypothetical protein